jgi:hypothetical protein
MGLIESRAHPDGPCPHRASEPEGGGDPLVPDEVGGVAEGTSSRDFAAIVPASGALMAAPCTPGEPLSVPATDLIIQMSNRLSISLCVSTSTPARGTQAQRGGGCPGRDRERDPGRIPRSDVAQRDAAVWKGSDRIHSPGALPLRMTPKGCLGSPAIVSLRS